MPQIRDRTVLFADLRGSTALYEAIGNAAATQVVTDQVAALGAAVVRAGGQVVKTLGDGLMAVFETPAEALRAADDMHDPVRAPGPSALPDTRPAALHLQVAIAHGEVVELAGDCFGDAVNVAARLLDHAGDNETLITADVQSALDARERARFRSLDRVPLRGRSEPVHVHLLEARRHVDDTGPTAFGGLAPVGTPQGVRLTWLDLDRYFDATRLPVVLGRGTDAGYCVADSRVSRLHARIDRHGGGFQLTDLSYNGTFVRFANEPEMLSLRRGTCTLHGSGVIALGTASLDPLSPCVHFEVKH